MKILLCDGTVGLEIDSLVTIEVSKHRGDVRLSPSIFYRVVGEAKRSQVAYQSTKRRDDDFERLRAAWMPTKETP